MTDKKFDTLLNDLLNKNPTKFIEVFEKAYKNYYSKYGSKEIPNLDIDKLQNQILFDGRHINDYYHSLESVDLWIDKCIDDIRNNLKVISYPLFVHLYLSMIQKGFWNEAKEFLLKYEHKFLPFKDEIYSLSLLKDPLNLDDNLLSNYLNNKVHIYIPKTFFDFFIHFLNTNNLILVLDIVNKYMERSIASFNDNSSKFVLLNLTGDEMDQINSKTSIYCSKIKKDMDLQIKGKSKAKGEKLTLSKVMIPIPEVYLENIPLEITNLKIDKHNLPTVGCFTILNSHNKMNCADITNDGSIISFGFKDGIILVWILDNDMQLDINEDILTSLKEYKELNYSKMLSKKDDKSFVFQKPSDKPSQSDNKSNLENPKSAFEEIIKKHRMIRLVGHTGSVFGISISPDRKYLISGSYDESVRLWNFVTKNTLVIYKGHFSPVLCVKFSPFSHYFASGGSDRTAKLWSVNKPGPLRLFVGHLSDVEIVDFHPNSFYLVTAANDRTIRLWSLESGNCVRVFFNSNSTYIDCLSFSNSGKLLAIGCNNCLILYDLIKMGDPIKIVDNFTCSPIYNLVFDNEDSVLTVSTDDYKIHFFSLQSILNDELSLKIVSKEEVKNKFDLIAQYVTKKTSIVIMKYTINNVLLTLGRFDDNNPKIFM